MKCRKLQFLSCSGLVTCLTCIFDVHDPPYRKPIQQQPFNIILRYRTPKCFKNGISKFQNIRPQLQDKIKQLFDNCANRGPKKTPTDVKTKL